MILIIIILTSIISVIAFKNRELFFKLSFNPYSIKHQKQYKRFITHIFIHSDWSHLLFNMLTLLFFGTSIERLFNTFYGDFSYVVLFILYFGGAVVSSIFSYKKYSDDIMYNAVGASGAVSSILFAFILFDPLSKIYLIFIPIGIPAFLFGAIYLGYSYFMSKRGNDNIGHDAHFWGAIFGFSLPIFFNPSLIIEFFVKIFG